MPVTNSAAQFLTWSLGSNIPNNYISSVEIGTGGGTASITDTTLNAGSLRVMITGSPDFSSARKVTFQADFNASAMSGVQLTEFGLFTSGTVGTGSAWQRESFSAITFDGTNELQIVSTIHVLPG